MSLFRSLSLRSALIAALHASAVRAEALAAWRTKLGFILAVSLVFCSVPQAHADFRASLRRSGRALDKREPQRVLQPRPRLAAHAPRLDQSAETRRRRGHLDDALGRYGYLPNWTATRPACQWVSSRFPNRMASQNAGDDLLGLSYAADRD